MTTKVTKEEVQELYDLYCKHAAKETALQVKIWDLEKKRGSSRAIRLLRAEMETHQKAGSDAFGKWVDALREFEGLPPYFANQRAAS